jgi:hypothetical protein
MRIYLLYMYKSYFLKKNSCRHKLKVCCIIFKYVNQYMLRLKNRDTWMLTWYASMARYVEQITKLNCIKRLRTETVILKI